MFSLKTVNQNLENSGSQYRPSAGFSASNTKAAISARSTVMAFPDFNILNDCIKVVACARFSAQEGSEDNQGHRHVHTDFTTVW